MSDKTRGTPENLVPWVKGQSGNPNGRPIGIKESLGSRLKRSLGQKPDQRLKTLCKKLNIDFDDCNVAEVLSGVLIGKATQGSIEAFELILKYTSPLPTQTVAFEGGITLTVIPPAPYNGKTIELPAPTNGQSMPYIDVEYENDSDGRNDRT